MLFVVFWCCVCDVVCHVVECLGFVCTMSVHVGFIEQAEC